MSSLNQVELKKRTPRERDLYWYKKIKSGEVPFWQYTACMEADRIGQERALLESLLEELPDAVFIPDNATAEANALGVGLAEYRYKVQTLLIKRLEGLKNESR